MQKNYHVPTRNVELAYFTNVSFTLQILLIFISNQTYLRSVQNLYLCILRQKSPFASPARRMGTKKAFKMIYCKWFSTLLAKIIRPAPGSLF